MATAKVHQQDDTVSITIPAETRTRMGFEAGQDLTIVEMDDGLKLMKRNPALDRQIKLAHEVLREEADTLRELSKR